MGCDVHVHFEVKINDKWEHYSAPRVDRWYAMFGKMAGVRSIEQTPISEPKGLPEDLSVITALDYKGWEGDAHNMSWFNAQEVAELIEWHEDQLQSAFEAEWKTWGYLFGDGWASVAAGDAKEEIQDIRLVFWFDN